MSKHYYGITNKVFYIGECEDALEAMTKAQCICHVFSAAALKDLALDALLLINEVQVEHDKCHAV
jgi:hypothetical protein